MLHPPTWFGRRTRARRLGSLLLALGVGACDFQDSSFVIEPEYDDVSSFEADLDKWTPRSIDLGTPPATWEVARSGERASQGGQAVRLRIGNTTGQAKAFIERRYAVEKNQTYLVAISFDFATADFSGVLPWGLIAGVSNDSPTLNNVVAIPANTANGRAADEGFVWTQKGATMELTSDSDGELYVSVGVAAASEGTRTYYVDNLKVTLTRRGISPPR